VKPPTRQGFLSSKRGEWLKVQPKNKRILTVLEITPSENAIFLPWLVYFVYFDFFETVLSFLVTNTDQKQEYS
jgi:hypothetical protein